MEGKHCSDLQKVNKKFHFLQSLSKTDRNTELLLSAWKILQRPITEYATPLWHSGLSKSDSSKLESLQKKAVGMILDTFYIEHKRYYKLKGHPVCYESALIHLDIISLAERREVLTSKFALQTFRNERHKDYFEINSNIRCCSKLKPSIQEYTCNTERLKNSAIPVMSEILNKMKLDISNISS